jgi:thiol:disulfide interchange protein DsbA
MNFSRRWLVLAAMALTSVVAFGATPGKEYVAINPPQVTSTPGKVEVIEFFSYACPHCNHFAPALDSWKKKAPSNVVVKLVPVTFGRGDWVTLAKLYYALDALGKSDSLHEKIFDAIHERHAHLSSPEACADWVVKQGVDRDKFLDAFNSFGVQSKISASTSRAQTYAIDGVPSIIIDGRYKTSPAMAGGNEAAIKLMDELIADLPKK